MDRSHPEVLIPAVLGSLLLVCPQWFCRATLGADENAPLARRRRVIGMVLLAIAGVLLWLK